MAAQISAEASTASASMGSNAGSNKGETGAGKVGIAFRASSLGLGGEVAYAVTHSSNIRGGVNFIGYSRGFSYDGIGYTASLRWLSAEAHYDWFPLSHFARSFHLSPGVMLYNDNHINATASIPGGNAFTLNGVSYTSDPAAPVTGTGKLWFNKAAPTLMVGFGNLVPRKKRKHFSFNIEGGIAYEGDPKIGLSLTGSVCQVTPLGNTCSDIATNPTVQSNVVGEQKTISNDLSPFKAYPLFALAFGYRL